MKNFLLLILFNFFSVTIPYDVSWSAKKVELEKIFSNENTSTNLNHKQWNENKTGSDGF